MAISAIDFLSFSRLVDYDILYEVWLKSDETVEGVVFQNCESEILQAHRMTPDQTQGTRHQKYPTYVKFCKCIE